MSERRGPKEVHQARRAVGDRLHRRVLAVEDAQRIAVQAPARILVERIGVPLEVGDQRSPVRAALVGLAEAVDLEANVVADDEAEVLEQRATHEDLLGIDVGAGVAHRLGADLVELAVAALLRPLVAKHRPDVEQALAAVAQERVLGHRTHDARGVLRAQGQAVAVHRVLERVHLLLDDVGHCAQAAHEQRGRLDDGRADVDVAVAAHQRANLALEPLPARRFRRQDVVHSLDGAQDVAHERLGAVRLACAVMRRWPSRSASRCSSRRGRETRWRCCRRAGSAP